MKAEKKRTHRIEIRLSDGEKELIETKFATSELKSLSDYLRWQAIFGKVIHVDDSHFDFIKRQLVGACTNINQIAFQANKSRRVSPNVDTELRASRKVLEDIFESVEQLRETVEGQLWQ
jgi:hypothetical protein